MSGYRIDVNRLRELRLGVPLTVAELARRAGLSYISLLKIEQGRQRPRISTIRALAAELRCDPAVLILVDRADTDVEGTDGNRRSVI